jgi:hypothetical protein
MKSIVLALAIVLHTLSWTYTNATVDNVALYTQTLTLDGVDLPIAPTCATDGTDGTDVTCSAPVTYDDSLAHVFVLTATNRVGQSSGTFNYTTVAPAAPGPVLVR